LTPRDALEPWILITDRGLRHNLDKDFPLLSRCWLFLFYIFLY